MLSSGHLEVVLLIGTQPKFNKCSYKRASHTVTFQSPRVHNGVHHTECPTYGDQTNMLHPKKALHVGQLLDKIRNDAKMYQLFQHKLHEALAGRQEQFGVIRQLFDKLRNDHKMYELFQNKIHEALAGHKEQSLSYVWLSPLLTSIWPLYLYEQSMLSPVSYATNLEDIQLHYVLKTMVDLHSMNQIDYLSASDTTPTQFHGYKMDSRRLFLDIASMLESHDLNCGAFTTMLPNPSKWTHHTGNDTLIEMFDSIAHVYQFDKIVGYRETEFTELVDGQILGQHIVRQNDYWNMNLNHWEVLAFQG